MSIYIEGFSLVIEALVFFFYFFNRKSIVKYNFCYLIVNALTAISIILDLVIYYLFFKDGVMHLVFFISYFYLCFLVLIAYSMFLYTINEIYNKNLKHYNILKIIASIFLIVAEICVLSSRVVIRVDSIKQPFLFGVSVYISYTMVLIYTISNLILIYLKRKRINRRKVLGITIYLLIVLSSIIFQYCIDLIIDNDYIIYFGGLSQAIGCLILYALIENAENNTDATLGLLNDQAFIKYIRNNFTYKRMSDIIIVTFDKSYYTTREEFNTLMINAANKVSKSIYKGFKFDSTTFILIRSKNKYGNIKTAIDNINNSLKEFAQISSNIHSKIFYIPKDLMFESSGQILKIIMQIIKTNREFDNSIRTITNYDIVKIENEIRISNLVDYCIKNEDVEINYQGIYAKDENRFAAAEALVRLRDKDNNIIYPQSFIPMVEEDGRIVELGMIIFKKVCQFMSKLDFEKLGLDYIEINLSPKQILDPNFIETYTNIIKTYNVNPKNINLEITETSRGFSKNIIDNINFLRNLGITFSLDDFGTGNSNLNYIVNMPVDIVKFDKTMVTSYFKDDIASLVVDYSIKMIKGLGHKIVFEGVENKNQIELIGKMSVDYIQGYYYTKPILEEKFLELIKNTNLKK